MKWDWRGLTYGDVLPYVAARAVSGCCSRFRHYLLYLSSSFPNFPPSFSLPPRPATNTESDGQPHRAPGWPITFQRWQATVAISRHGQLSDWTSAGRPAGDLPWRAERDWTYPSQNVDNGTISVLLRGLLRLYQHFSSVWECCRASRDVASVSRIQACISGFDASREQYPGSMALDISWQLWGSWHKYIHVGQLGGWCSYGQCMKSECYAIADHLDWSIWPSAFFVPGLENVWVRNVPGDPEGPKKSLTCQVASCRQREGGRERDAFVSLSVTCQSRT